MPELPEVETIVRGLRVPLIGRKVRGMWYDWARMIHSPDPVEFAARIEGQTFRAVNRRAKYILCTLDDDTLVIHLKMSGRLYVAADETQTEADKWVHFCLQLDGGRQLRFSDARKFGRIYLSNQIESITGALGPEPLADNFSAADLQTRLHDHKRTIKALLLDQTFIAGVGNIYADEALFRAGIHPLRRSDSLSPEESAHLYDAIRNVLQDAIEYQGASVNWYRTAEGKRGQAQTRFAVYGREGEPCPNCGHPIEKIRVVQRGTHYCPVCQPQMSSKG